MQKQDNTVSKLLPLLARHSGEVKLRIAFRLNSFVNRLRAEGKRYETTAGKRARTTS